GRRRSGWSACLKKRRPQAPFISLLVLLLAGGPDYAQPAAACRLLQARRSDEVPDEVGQREHALVRLAVVELQRLELARVDAPVDLVGREGLRIELVRAHRHGPERTVERDIH